MPRYNLARNPAAATALTGWLSSPAATRVTGQTVGNTGRATAAQTTTGTAAYSAYLSGGNAAASASASGGKAYSWVAWVYSSVARTIRPGIIRWNGTSPVAAQYAADVTLAAGTWTQIRGNATLPTGGTYTALCVHIDLPTTGTAGQLRLSAVRIEQITDTTLTFADGDTPDGRWGWDGTAGSSTSTQSDAISASVPAQIATLALSGQPASSALGAFAAEVVVDTATLAPGGSVSTAPDSARFAVLADRATGAADRADVTPAPVVVVFGPTVGFPSPNRYPGESDYPRDAGESYDATVSTVVLTRAQAWAVAVAVDASGTVATTAIQALAVVATAGLTTTTTSAQIGPVPAVAAVAVPVEPTAITAVAVADVYPPTVLVTVVDDDAESRSAYSIPVVVVLVAFRALGALVPRGNLALVNLDALIGPGPVGLYPSPTLHPSSGGFLPGPLIYPGPARLFPAPLCPRGSISTGVDVVDLQIPDLDGVVAVTSLDAAVAQAELNAAVLVVEMAATADTRGT